MHDRAVQMGNMEELRAYFRQAEHFMLHTSNFFPFKKFRSFWDLVALPGPFLLEYRKNNQIISKITEMAFKQQIYKSDWSTLFTFFKGMANVRSSILRIRPNKPSSSNTFYYFCAKLRDAIFWMQTSANDKVFSFANISKVTAR